MAVDPASPITPSTPDAGVGNVRGIALMAFGFFMFSVCDVQAKFLTGAFHPMQIVWTRQLGSCQKDFP